MAHPRIEEVEDSDDAFSDPSEGDIDDFDEADILQSRKPAAPATAAAGQRMPTMPMPMPTLPTMPGPGEGPPPAFGSFPALYPVYFDRSRSRADGRRVSRSLAVANPLAREIVSACTAMGLRVVFEPTKTHPKDWANPGRVKIDLAPHTQKKGQQGPGRLPHIQGKHHLYILVARYLAQHPTTEDSAGLRETVRGAPPPPPRGEPYPRPAIPRGWKMPALVPYLSPAMTGGGVSENLLQDMMKEMQGGGGAGGMPGMPGMPGMGMPGGGLPDMQRAMAALGGGGASAAAPDKKSKKGKGRA